MPHGDTLTRAILIENTLKKKTKKIKNKLDNVVKIAKIPTSKGVSGTSGGFGNTVNVSS